MAKEVILHEVAILLTRPVFVATTHVLSVFHGVAAVQKLVI